MPLAGQLVHQRSTSRGPLVLPGNLVKSLIHVADKDRTVLRRSEPSSRTTLTGEQPDPWDLLQPQDVMSRHRDLLLSALTIPSSSFIIVRGASLLGKLYIVQ